MGNICILYQKHDKPRYTHPLDDVIITFFFFLSMKIIYDVADNINEIYEMTQIYPATKSSAQKFLGFYLPCLSPSTENYNFP